MSRQCAISSRRRSAFISLPDELTHIDDAGSARMVDVGGKDVTDRRAVARAVVRMSPETAAAVARGDAPKGDVIGTARIAGIQAAKRTAELIPLCHPLPITGVEVDLAVEADAVRVTATVRTTGRTGVEMEALTACSVACLTIYDMCKSADRSMTIGDVALWEKTGGRSGVYRRAPDLDDLDL
jgi:cyclic pyranopterin monophosphate synthase